MLTLGDKGKIGMFECARRDPNVSIAETMGALVKLVGMGAHIYCTKLGDLGANKVPISGVALSEVNAATIREAAKITNLVAVEVELSLWCTDALENGVTGLRGIEYPMIA